LGKGELLAKDLVLVAEAAVVIEEVSAAGAGELGLSDGLLDLGSMVVDGLTRAAGVLGLRGDAAVLAAQHRKGIADPVEDG
jgi:hypothetical protein